MDMLEPRIQQHFFDSADLQYQTAETLSRPLAEAAQAIVGALTSGGKLLIGGGAGGAAALAAYAATLAVGRFERERPPLAALALVTDVAAVAQLQALGQPGDVLLLLSAGGDVAPLRALLDAAHSGDLSVVLLAPAGSALFEPLTDTDVAVAVPHERAARLLEAELLALHALADAVDLQLMGEQDPA